MPCTQAIEQVPTSALAHAVLGFRVLYELLLACGEPHEHQCVALIAATTAVKSARDLLAERMWRVRHDEAWHDGEATGMLCYFLGTTVLIGIQHDKIPAGELAGDQRLVPAVLEAARLHPQVAWVQRAVARVCQAMMQVRANLACMQSYELC